MEYLYRVSDQRISASVGLSPDEMKLMCSYLYTSNVWYIPDIVDEVRIKCE